MHLARKIELVGEAARQRDEAAQMRDELAAERDRIADIAEERALETEGSDGLSNSPMRPVHELRGRGPAGRKRAARDRERARCDRELARADREFDREASAVQGHLVALVDCSEDTIIAKTLDGVIESWNRAAQELFGYTAAEAVGKPIAMLVPPERRDELAEILAHISRGERVNPLETVRGAKGGRMIAVSLRISLVYDSDARLVGATSIARDITGQKLLEAQLRRRSRYFDFSRDLMVACDFDGRFTKCQPRGRADSRLEPGGSWPARRSSSCTPMTAMPPSADSRTSPTAICRHVRSTATGPRTEATAGTG